MQWYKHYIADYLQDTADLSLIEHGAYRLLLDAYYQRESPLPADWNLIFRICRAHSRHEKDAVRRIVERFTETLNGHLTVSRADKEILKYQQRSAANRDRNRDPTSARFAPKNSEREKEVRSTSSPTRGLGGQNLLKKFPEPPDNREAIEKNRRIAEHVASGNLEAARKLRGSA